MRRSGPIRRGSPPLRRSPLRRRRPPDASGKSPTEAPPASLEAAARLAFALACQVRAGGRCEVDDPEACATRSSHRGTMAHHVVSRARGVGWPGLHLPANGLWLCASAHAWIHGNPALATEAGWLASRPTNLTP